LRENKQEARDELIKLGVSEAVIETSWQHASDDYFLRYSADEIVWHTIAITSSKEPICIGAAASTNQRGSAEIFVYTKNEGPVFSLSTATLDQLGLTILDARIMTT